MRQAFSLLELFLAIALSGVMAFFVSNYLNLDTLSKENIKTRLRSHFNIITATIFQCKELSNTMPLQSDSALANNTRLDILECNTSTPYPLDGTHGGFIPSALEGFSAYTATEDGSAFYFSTTTEIGSRDDEALQELEGDFSTNQYELIYDATTATLNFYLSR